MGAFLNALGGRIILAVLVGIAAAGAGYLANTYRTAGRHEWHGYGPRWAEGELWADKDPEPPPPFRPDPRLMGHMERGQYRPEGELRKGPARRGGYESGSTPASKLSQFSTGVMQAGEPEA